MGFSGISDLCGNKRPDDVGSTFITEVAAFALEMRQQKQEKTYVLHPGDEH